jgi:hypothetical protein
MFYGVLIKKIFLKIKWQDLIMISKKKNIFIQYRFICEII